MNQSEERNEDTLQVITLSHQVCQLLIETNLPPATIFSALSIAFVHEMTRACIEQDKISAFVDLFAGQVKHLYHETRTPGAQT
jgi:hypothetical protein